MIRSDYRGIFLYGMEQQHLNKCETPDPKEIGNRGGRQKGDSIEQVKINKGLQGLRNSDKEKSLQELSRSRSDSYEDRGSEQEFPEARGQVGRLNPRDHPTIPLDNIFDKKLKIKHHKKCSGCLKKHLNHDVLCCANCPKSYHRTCLTTPILKNSQPFLCQACDQVIRERHLKRALKRQLGPAKQPEPQKAAKTQDKPIRRIVHCDDHNPSQLKSLQDFADQFPLYIQNGKIQFPIQDRLLQEYADIMPRNSCTAKPAPTKRLEPWFGTVLEAWNTIQTFEDTFSDYSRLSVFELSELMQSAQSLVGVQKLFLVLSDFFCKDLFNEKFQSNRVLVTNPFLYLLKYCSQIGTLHKIIKYVWIELLLNISTVPDFAPTLKDQGTSRVLKKLRYKSGELWMPNDNQDRLLLLQTVLNGVVETTTYHDQLYSKIEKGRQNTRLKNGALESVKELESNLKEIVDQKKALSKQIKDKSKALGNPIENTKLSKQLDEIQQQLVAQEEAEREVRQHIRIQKQNISLASENVSYTNVQFVGKDKQDSDYWFVMDSRDKLFVNTNTGAWFYYDLQAINHQLPKSLNPKGVREKGLLQTLQQYRKKNYFGNLTQSDSQLKDILSLQEQFYTSRTQYMSRNADVDFDREEFISFDFVKRLLLLGERKIHHYLDQKNARWGTSDDRQAYISRVKDASTNKELVQAARFLNEKICVVEIEYVQVDDDGQQVTECNKMRKVQTKMWGINQKYKHAWLQYLLTCDDNALIEVFFLVAVLFLTIDRYVSKMRETKKPKKDCAEDPIPRKENRILNKRTEGEKKKINAFQWEETCNVCQQFGDLLCCDLCPKVYHLGCIDLAEVPDGNFQCRECDSKRHTRSITKKIGQVPKP